MSTQKKGLNFLDVIKVQICCWAIYSELHTDLIYRDSSLGNVMGIWAHHL